MKKGFIDVMKQMAGFWYVGDIKNCVNLIEGNDDGYPKNKSMERASWNKNKVFF